jgi:hypothetical protein
MPVKDQSIHHQDFPGSQGHLFSLTHHIHVLSFEINSFPLADNTRVSVTGNMFFSAIFLSNFVSPNPNS